MFINAISHYLPKEIIPNDYFSKVNGLSNSWIYERTGIKTRTKASKNETTNSMGINAVRRASQNLQYDIQDVDLIVGASYTPFDTVGTLAHSIQREFNIRKAKAVYLSSACSSLLNAVELVEGYFASGKAKKALVVVSEHNWAYNNEADEKSGHLWGDGAACMFISKECIGDKMAEIKEVFTQGLGHIGYGTEAVYARPRNGGIGMPYGKDVFVNACSYMIKALDELTKNAKESIDDLNYIIPHQANMRIINNIAKSLKISRSKLLTNIEELGNTGCASTLIALSQNMYKMKEGVKTGITVFGGGYSCGAMLIQF